MKPEFWHERWQQGQVGFHQPDFHPALERYWPGLGVEPPVRVFVPLCGRSLDMIWLARRGHGVLGVELSPIAAAGFFEHESLQPETSPAGAFTRHAAGPYELLQGDFFDLDRDAVGAVGGWYDRAALVALPPDMRRQYVRHLATLLPSGARGLLLTHDYPQEQMDGPPFSVPADEVRELYATDFELELLSSRDVIASAGRFAERGIGHFIELVFRVVRR